MITDHKTHCFKNVTLACFNVLATRLQHIIYITLLPLHFKGANILFASLENEVVEGGTLEITVSIGNDITLDREFEVLVTLQGSSGEFQ